MLVLGTGISVVVLGHPLAASNSFELWLSVIGATVTGLGSVWLCLEKVGRRASVHWARIGPIFGGYFAVVFGLFSLGWLSPQQGIAATIEPTLIPGSVAVSMIGLSMWTIGYIAGAPRIMTTGLARLVDRIFPGSNQTFRFAGAPVVVYLIGLGARLYQLHTSSYGYLQNAQVALSSPSPAGHIVALLGDFAAIGLVMAAIDAFALSRSSRSKIILTALLTAEIGNGLFSGSKQSVVVSIASVGLVYVLATGRVPRRAALLLLLGVLLVFPLVTSYRGSIRGSGTVSVTSGTAETQLIRTLSDGANYAPNVVFIDSPAAIAHRLREIDNVAIIRQKSPGSIPYKPWSDLVIDPLIDWFPRFLWPTKPILSTGAYFSQTYYGIPSSVTTASAVTIPGDLLRHGGGVPLALGMLALGMLVAMMDTAVDPTTDVRRLVLFIPLLVMLVKSESGMTALVVGIVDLFVAVAFANFLAFTRSPS